MPERSDLKKPVSPTDRPTLPEPPVPVETTSQVAYSDPGGLLPPVFGRYRILRQLGAGGMGAVYLAEDTKLERQVALKVPLIPQGHTVARERFLREAKAMAAFDHPHLCRIYDVDELNGVLYYTMPFIEGQPLASWVTADKQLSQKQVAILVHKLASALAFAHAKGIIHRDLKPLNVMIRKSADKGVHEPIIMDFGLARRDQTDDLRLTQTGAAMGTLPYMSPEQLKGDTKNIGPGCDIYSLGALLYELLTGRWPLVRNSSAELQAAILLQTPADPRTIRPELDRRLAEIALKCLQKEVGERYRSMKELAEELAEVFAKPATRQANVKKAKTDPNLIVPTPTTTARLAPRPRALPPTKLETADEELPMRRGSQAWIAVAGVVGGVVLVAVVIVFMMVNLGHNEAGKPTVIQTNGTSTSRLPAPTGTKSNPIPPPPVIPEEEDDRPLREPERLRPNLSSAQVQQIQKAWAQYLGRKVEEELDLGGGVSMIMVLVPPGRFKMGTSDAQADEAMRLDKDLKREHMTAEQPQHDVEITRPFYLGKHEVTQEQYQRILGATPSWFCSTGRGKDKVAGMDTRQFPVETVSWQDSTAFCDKLAAQAAVRRLGTGCRLPSEAEWEYACRAGTSTYFHFGDRLNGAEANCDGNYPFGTSATGPCLDRTARVGSYAPNALGLQDLHGNVWEWCQDGYDEECYANSPARDPLNEQHTTARVLRGGSWSNGPKSCRAADRFRITPDDRSLNLGFRVVVSVPPRTQ